MRIAIYQPRYFPQLHYFNRLTSVDTFVILDNAQYTKALTHKNGQIQVREKSYQSDTPIRLSNNSLLLTVPVIHHGYMPLNQTRIDYQQKWGQKHLVYLKVGYQKAENFLSLYPQIKDIVNFTFSTLAELNIATTVWALAYLLGISLPISECTLTHINEILKQHPLRLKKILTSKDLTSERPDGLHKGTEWTVAICKELHASEYMHGKTAMENYMDESRYKANGIQTVLQQWTCQTYHQQFPKYAFSPNLSILDLLLNVSLKDARKIIGIDIPYENSD